MKIGFIGDIALIGKYDAAKNGTDTVLKRFSQIVPIIKQCDYLVGNLETPLTSERKSSEAKTLALKTSPKNVEVLKGLGINAVSLANNHVFDYGKKGYIETKEVLTRYGIDYFGVENKTVVFIKGDDQVETGGFCCLTTNGWHFNIYSKKGCLNTLTRNSIDSFLDRSEKNKRLPIIFVHWGEENTHYPRIEHIKLAEHICENKAVVIGHHPHVLQGLKHFDKGSFVAYSLGNFCFDNFSDNTCNVKLKQTIENLKGMIIVFDYSQGSISNVIKYTYIDRENGFELSSIVNEEVESYGKALWNGIDTYQYNQTRKSEISIAMKDRLGKRDIHWLIGHLKYKAIRAVIQRKINQRVFKQLSKDF